MGILYFSRKVRVGFRRTGETRDGVTEDLCLVTDISSKKFRHLLLSTCTHFYGRLSGGKNCVGTAIIHGDTRIQWKLSDRRFLIIYRRS